MLVWESRYLGLMCGYATGLLGPFSSCLALLLFGSPAYLDCKGRILKGISVSNSH